MDRKEAGRKIAFEQPGRIRRTDGTWVVQGSSGTYEVRLKAGACTCPDKTYGGHRHRCKHWWAVWFIAEIPVEHEVRRVGDGMWAVAVLRAGIRIALVCPRSSPFEAHAALGRLRREEELAAH